MKRVISLILSIAMIASLATGLAVTGFADESITVVGGNEAYYEISKDTITITNDVTLNKINKNLGDLTIYIPTGKTLTVLQPIEDPNIHTNGLIWSQGNITIYGGGTLCLEATVFGYTTIMSSDDSVNIIGCTVSSTSTGENCDGIYGKSISIINCPSVTISANKSGILANGSDVAIENSVVEINGKTECGIMATNVVISNSTVTATSKFNACIYGINGIDISNNSIVNAKGPYPIATDKVDGIKVNGNIISENNVGVYFNSEKDISFEPLGLISCTDWVCCNAGAAEPAGPAEPAGTITINGVDIEDCIASYGGEIIATGANSVTVDKINTDANVDIYIPTGKTLTVSQPNEDEHNYTPIYCGGNITITGGGTLNVIGYRGSNASIWALDTRIDGDPQYLDGDMGNIYIDGCTISATNIDNHAIYAEGNIIIVNNSKITSNASGSNGMGVFGRNGIGINNSIITATSENIAIGSFGKINIDNNSIINAKGPYPIVSMIETGIIVNDVTITNLNVENYFHSDAGGQVEYSNVIVHNEEPQPTDYTLYVVSGTDWVCCNAGAAEPAGPAEPAGSITINDNIPIENVSIQEHNIEIGSLEVSGDGKTITVDKIWNKNIPVLGNNDLKINIPEGKTLIVSNSNGECITTNGGTITITGGGTLNCIAFKEGTSCIMAGDSGNDQKVNNIIIDGCIVNLTNTNGAGMDASYGQIIITNSEEVTVTAKIGCISSGVSITIDNSNVTVESKAAAAISSSGTINIDGNSTVKTKGVCLFVTSIEDGIIVNNTVITDTNVETYFGAGATYKVVKEHYEEPQPTDVTFYVVSGTDWVCYNAGPGLLPVADPSKITYKITSEDPKEAMVTGYKEDMPEGCSLTIPATFTSGTDTYDVTSIGESAFDECTKLASIEIPNSVISIGNNAFNFCSALTDVSIPSSVQNIGFAAFAMCSSLENINVDATNKVYTSIDGILYSNNGEELICYPAGKSATSFEVPSSVTKIDEYAFAFCSALTDITIPSSINNIGYLAFVVCTGLENIGVNVANTVYASIDGILYSNNGEELICYPAGKKATSFEVSNSVNIIDDYAFAYNSALTSVTIGENVTNIGESAFAICSALTRVTIGDNVTTIGKEAFSECTELTSVTFGANVKTIGERAFTECTGLTSIEIPEGVTSIGEYAFNNCSSLTSVTVKAATPPSLGSKAFNYCSNLTSIYVPALSVGAYKSAPNWASYAGKIFEIPAEPGIETIITFSGKVITADSDIYYCKDESTFKNESDATTNGSKSLTLTKGYMYTLKVSDTVFYVNYVVKEITIQANPNELAEDLSQARELINKVVTKTNRYLTGSASGNVYTTVEAYNAFNKAITDAEEVKNNSSHKQLEIDGALVELNGALRTFISTLRADTWYLSGNEVTRTDISDTDVFTESYAVLNTVTDATTYNSVKSTLLIKVGEKYSYSTSYVVYANVDDENAYSDYEKSQQTPHSPTDNPQPIDPPSPQPEVKPITINYNDGKFGIVEVDLFDVRGIYYGYGSKGDLSETDYFGLNGFSECYALGNGTHTFKVLATNKSTGETKLYEDIEYTVTGLTDPVAVNQNGVVFINFENTPSKIYYEKGGKTIYVPIEKGLKLDADNFAEVTEITFDTKTVTIK